MLGLASYDSILFVFRGCLIAVFLMWILLSPLVAMPFYNMILFHPTTYPDGVYQLEYINGIKKQDVFFSTGGGSKLHAWWFPNPKPGPVVLISHGNGGNLTYRGFLIKGLLDSGASVFAYDYRGYGRSEGNPSVTGICEDGRAAYEYLRKELSVPPERIVLYGESLGTGVTTKLAEQVPCAGVVLQSSYVSLRRAGEDRLKMLRMYPRWLFPQPELDNAAYVKRSHPPLLLVHGANDRFLPRSYSEELFREAAEPKNLVLIPRAEHNDVPDQTEYVPALTKFLQSLSVLSTAQEST